MKTLRLLFQIWFVCATLFAFLVSSNASIALAQTQPTQPPITLPVISAPRSAATAIAAGASHTCALTTSGGIKCWGENYSGQLGDGTTTNRNTPIDVSGLTNGVSAITAGVSHTCALTTSGGVKCWGINAIGQLGDGTGANRYTPVDVIGLTSGVSAIAAGENHTCALTTSGGVKCWGYNYYGQLGDSTTTNRIAPVDVGGLTSGVSAIVAGDGHTCALTTSGGVKCLGANLSGQLGDGTTTLYRAMPVDVSGLTSGVSVIAAGWEHTCALTTSGGVKCWGDNQVGEIGDGTTTLHRTTPVDVSGLTSGVSAIATSYSHTCALTTSGGVKCWGYNGYGQLGDGTTTQRNTPVDASGLTSGVSAIATGSVHTCALATSGGVKCLGANLSGQLGDGTTTNRYAPVDVVGFGGVPPPFLDLPFTYSNFSQSANGNVNGNGGRVNSWFDHTSPDYSVNNNLTRYDSRVFNFNLVPSQIGVSWYDGHNGIDFQKRVTDEQILATASGIVLNTTLNPLVTGCLKGNRACGNGYGNQVWINHGNGYATLYGHCL